MCCQKIETILRWRSAHFSVFAFAGGNDELFLHPAPEDNIDHNLLKKCHRINFLHIRDNIIL